MSVAPLPEPNLCCCWVDVAMRAVHGLKRMGYIPGRSDCHFLAVYAFAGLLARRHIF